MSSIGYSPLVIFEDGLHHALFEVMSISEDIRDVKGIVIRNDAAAPFFFGALILFLLISFLLLLRVIRKKKRVLLLRPPHEVALEALQSLHGKEWVTKGKFKEHYFEMAEIIRRYLDDGLGLKTLKMTTEECLSNVEETHELRQEEEKLLEELLKQCDRVKFAGYPPSSEECGRSFLTAQEIILRTKDRV